MHTKYQKMVKVRNAVRLVVKAKHEIKQKSSRPTTHEHVTRKQSARKC